MSDEIADLYVTLRGNEEGFVKSMSNAVGAVGGFSDKLEGGTQNVVSNMAQWAASAAGLSSEMLPMVGGGIAVAGALGLVAAQTTDMASKFDDSTINMQNNAHITKGAADGIGQAFLQTAGQSVFSGQEMMDAFAPVAGQLELIQGKALNAAQAVGFMTTAGDLAEATNGNLKDTTAGLATVLQTFQLKTSDAAAASDVLVNTSSALNVPLSDLESEVETLHSKMGPTGGSLTNVSTALVDMTTHGLTGGTAIKELGTAVDHLLQANDKVPDKMSKAQSALQSATDAYDKLTAAHGVSAEALDLAHQKMDREQGILDKMRNSTDATSDQIAQQQRTVDSATLAYDRLANSTGNSTDAINKARDKMQSAQADLNMLKGGVGDLGLTLYNSQGQFVGIASVIAQLQPKLEGMSTPQREVAENALFGNGAFEKLDGTIMAGVPGWQTSAKAVDAHGSAMAAAHEKSDTLKGNMAKLQSAASDLGVEMGLNLLPYVTDFTTGLTHVVTWAIAGEDKTHIIGTTMRLTGDAFGYAAGQVEQIVSWVETFIGMIPHAVSAIDSFGNKVQAMPANIVNGIGGGVNSFINGFQNALPHFAAGGLASGMFVAGEEGPEVIQLPAGVSAQVTSNSALRQIPSLSVGSGGGSGGGGDIYIASVVVQGVQDVESMNRELRRAALQRAKSSGVQHQFGAFA